MSSPTPVRALGTVADEGYRLVRDVESGYRDGGEPRVLEIIRNAGDVSSTSDELIVSATTWAERYHLHPTRANVVRALELPTDARVLEVGAGCGAITRFLGERCALVDALEPVPARAAAAAERTRDLDNVEVVVGMLADVPAQPTYDVIAVVGVLEYVGAGTADLAPYLEFLAQVRERLVDGGTLVLCIENRLGVKYLVGAPEDHTGRFFDSVEGYPVGGKARTFTRLQLETMLRDSGLDPRSLIAFPDYKLTRAVLDEMPAGRESLLHRIPRTPSPDWTKPRPRVADEGRVWRSLVEGGVGLDFGNSLVLLAGKGGPSEGIWPADRLATFFSTDRRPPISTRTVVENTPDGVRFVRDGLTAGEHRVGTLELRGSVAAYEPGRDLLDVVAEGGFDAAAPLLTQWLALLQDAVDAGGPVPIDLVPHNLLVDGDTLRVIDIELFDSAADRGVVLRRGVFWLAERITRMAAPAQWEPARTVGEVMAAFGALAGLPEDGSWIADAVREEAEVAVTVRPGPPTGSTLQQWRERLVKDFARIPERKLAGLAVGERVWETHKRTAGQLEKSQARVRELEASLARVTKELGTAQKALTGARTEASALRKRTAKSRARRVGGKVLPRGSERRRAVARLIPPGSAQRKAVSRLLRR